MALWQTKLISVAVRNLPIGVQPREIATKFEEAQRGCRPKAAKPIPEHNSNGPPTTSCCIVSFVVRKALGDKSFEDQIDALENTFQRQPLIDGNVSRVAVIDQDFFGITPLYEHEEGADIDIYIIHGLGGHAFTSFTNKIDTRSQDEIARLCNWAMDLLPTTLDENNIKARISTVGYNGNTIRRPDRTADLAGIAEQILSDLKQDRSTHPQRPMYFMCHSLGGILLCRALNMALYKHRTQGIERPLYTPIFLSHPDSTSCILRGVVFMGTPFNGSLEADKVYPLAKMLNTVNPFPMNIGLIKGLRFGAGTLYDIRSTFEALQKRYRIGIAIGYETDSVVTDLTSLITTRDSAVSIFNQSAHTFKMAGSDHKELVRFNSADQNYQRMVSALIELMRPRPSSVTSDDAVLGTGASQDNSIRAINHTNRSGTIGHDTRPIREHSPSRGFSMSGFQIHIPINLSTTGYPRPQAENDPRNFPRSPSPIQEEPRQRGPAPAPPPRAQGDRNEPYASLRMMDTVFLIDDTGSMTVAAEEKRQEELTKQGSDEVLPDRWSVLKECMKEIVDIAITHDEDGIDVRFLCGRSHDADNVTESRPFLATLEEMRPQLEFNSGGTYFSQRLENILRPAVNRWRRYKQHRDSVLEGQGIDEPRGVNLIVITDGKADDEERTADRLIEIGRTLKGLDAPRSFLGVQFVQIGDNEEAAEWLRYLDDDLKNESGIDFVDTTPWHHSVKEKALMGAYNRLLDKRQTTVRGERSSAHTEGHSNMRRTTQHMSELGVDG